MAFWPGGTSLCPWSVLWSGGLTMGSDRRRPPTSGGIRRGKSTVWDSRLERKGPGRDGEMPVQAAVAKGNS